MTTWTVPATVLRVIDGDTLHVSLDLGWHLALTTNVRLAFVNAPEMATADGVAARTWVLGQLQRYPSGDVTEYRPITVVSHSLDKYGRVLGEVFYAPDGSTGGPLALQTNLGDALLAAGHAVPMRG